MADVNRRVIHLQCLKSTLISNYLIRRGRRVRIPTKRRFWVRKLFRERRMEGLYNVLIKDLMLFDHEYFFKALKMSPTQLEQLLTWVGPLLLKSSNIRDVLPLVNDYA